MPSSSFRSSFSRWRSWFGDLSAKCKLETIGKLLFLAIVSLPFAVLAGVHVCIKNYFKRRKYYHIPGPKPSSLLLGNLPDLMIQLKRKIYPVYIQEWYCFNKYGDLFMLQMADRFIVYTASAAAVKRVLLVDKLGKAGKLYQKIGFPLGERLFGHSLVLETNADKWREKRLLIQPIFKKNVLAGLMERFNVKSNFFIDRLTDLADSGEFFALRGELERAVFDMISDVGFGVDFDQFKAQTSNSSNIEASVTSLNDQDKTSFLESAQVMFASMYQVLTDPLLSLKPNRWPFICEFRSACATLRSVCRKHLISRIEAIQQQAPVPNDFLTVFLLSHNNSKKDRVEDELESLVDHFLSLLIASQETTVESIHFCFFELARNPKIYEKLQSEVDEKLDDRSIIDSLGSLDYAACVFKETLRMWPVVASINRHTNEALSLEGYEIPADTDVALSSFHMHRSSRFHSEPNQFRPERFQTDPETKTNSIQPYTYFPFSLGPRNCLGQSFVMLEAKLLLAKVAQKFHIELDGEIDRPELEYSLTLKLKKSLMCRLKLRNNN